MLQPRGTTGALQRICPRCGPYGRWANQDDRMGSRCHDESEVRALRLSAVLGKERKSPGLTDSSQRCSATPITWSPCSNPSAIGLFNSKLPPGPPKKGGRTWPNYQGQRLLFAILGPWCHIAASHGESLDGCCACQEALAADARMALRGPAAVTAQVGINQGSHLHLRSLPRSSLAKMTYLLFGEERWQKIQRFLQPEHLLL